MKFKGTIVITDPCYLDQGLEENLWEKSDYGDHMSVFGCSQSICKDTLYGDWSCFTYKGFEEDVKDAMEEWKEYYFTFFDEYYSIEDENEQKEFFDEFETKQKEFLNKYALGQFCADAGMVCVVYLEEILKVNPNFKEWLNEHPWCATIIENFDGDIEYIVDNKDDAHIIGKGNISFYTAQSGL